MSIVKPVNFLDEFVCFGAETDWFDVQVSKAFVLRVADELLGLDGHELGVKPSSEHLAVERLVPAVMIVLVCVLQLHRGGVGLNLSDVEEHFVNFLVGVGMGTAQIIGLSDCLLHFQTVHNGKRHIGNVDWLYQCVHSFYLPVHTVEHFHLHAPFGGDSWVLMQQVHDVSRADDCYIRVDSLYFLLSDPLGTQTSGLRVGVSTSCRDINESLYVFAVFGSLRDRHWNSNVGIFKILLLLVENF